MTELTPIRFYLGFMKQDWPNLPVDAQNALASFLLTLQKEPNSLEIAANAQRDAEGRLGYEFSPGFLVYWRVVKEEVRFLQPNIGPSERIEVLALVSAGIKISEPAAGVGGAPLNMEQEIAE